MNVTQLAKHLGISKPTLYKRVKDAGLQLDDLRESTGELTAQGAAAISALFDDKTPVLTETRNADQHQHLTQVDAELRIVREQLDAAKRENDLLREVLASKDAEIQHLKTDLEAWRSKAQAIDVQQLLLATAAAAAPRRRGLLDAIKAAFTRNDG